MEITDERHRIAVKIESAALADSIGKETPATYWLALAISLLTSSSKEEREAGKALARRWKKHQGE